MTSTFLLKLWRDERAQDLIEYALTVGFVAVAAGAAFPTGIAPSIYRVFSRVKYYMELSAAQG